jgi:two-component sensor histidine kinase
MYKISYKSLFETKTDWLNFTARFCFQVSLIIGLIAVVGWVFEMDNILSIKEDFLPIAPDTAIIILILSTILFYRTFNKTYKIIKVINITLVSIIIFYVILKITDIYFHTELAFTNALFPTSIYRGAFLIKRMSPITGMLFLVSGTASIIYLSNHLRAKYYNAVGILGCVVLLISFIITIGYSFGTPLFYNGIVIPVALPTALGLAFIGLGIAAGAGPESFINRLFTGTSVRALLVRSFIPLIIISVIIVGFLHQMLDFTNLNQGLAASLTMFIFIAVTIFISIKIAVKISSVIDKAENERRLAEEKLKDNLAEKETLLKELNHRVKNNFNLINSIIELSMHNTNSIEDMQNSVDMIKKRIFTISLIHKQLYNSKTLTDVDFKNYVIKLTESLKMAYNNGKTVSINYDIGDIALPITKAIPCGLIINELVVNSFKYAFAGIEDCRITISFNNVNGFIEMSIIDNGTGLPDKFDLETSETLGYTIIRELSSQLDAEYAVSSKKGTAVKFKFSY